jgi:hypothetical protein
MAPEAEADIAEAYGWYERQRIGLGEDFLSCPSRSMPPRPANRNSNA